jgi:hypothetical protein
MKKILVCCIILLSAVLGHAQVANNTSLVGTVTDSAGAVIVDAKVTAVERDSKVAYPTTTNNQGYFSIPNILPGTYDVTVEHGGFEKTLSSGVLVTLNQAARTDVTLKIGSEATEVTVAANTKAIQTDDSLLGETVTEAQIENLPMNGRNALDLANVASNVTVSTGSALTGVPPGKTASGAGTRGVNNSLTLDGITIMNNLGSTATVQPNPDALGAVQTQNGNYTAQYGNYLGIHINEATKSGTNAIHGTGYDYIQNDALNSRGFNRSSTVPKKNELRYNLFGGVFSGPVYIPHLYNGKNKTFFLASYEGLRTHTVTNSYSQAFDAAERAGDFTELLNPTFNGVGKAILLYSPIDGHPYYNPANGTQIINDRPAANAPIVNNILAYAVSPNVANPVSLAQNYLQATPAITNENSSVDRIDENIGDKIRIFGRYLFQKTNYVSTAREYVNNNYNPTDVRNAAAGITYIISPNLVNDLRGGFNWLTTDSLDYFYVNGPKNADAALGLPGPFGIGQATGNPGLPDITGGNSFSESESGDNWIQDDRTYQIYDQISWTHGKHAIMAGVDIRRLNIGRAAVNSARGILAFASSYTQPQATSPAVTCPVSQGCTTGSTDASLYLGILSQSTTPLAQVKEEVTQWRDGFFVQDTWQVYDKLTLEYGLRYELPKVPYSANGYARLLDPTNTFLIPTSTATTPTTYTPNPGLALTGPNHKDFAPRFGLSYRVTDKIVVRGGGGIYYNANHLNAYTLTSSNYPFASSVIYPSPSNGSASATNPYVTLASPTPGAGTAPPMAGIPGTYVTAYSVANHLPSETMYQWNLDNGLELWRNGGIEFQYLGSHSIHLDTNYYPNQPIPHLVNTSVSTLNSLRPNQNFGQIRVADNFATATYEGLTTVFRQRGPRGVNVNLSYTWAHALDESPDANSGGSTMIQGNAKADYGNSSSDVRHKAVLSFDAALPSPKWQNFLVQEALAGWQVNGIVSVQSGSPFNVSFGSTDWAYAGVPQSGSAPQRPNYVHRGKMTCTKQTLINEPYGQNNISCVDMTAYAAPARFTYGNLHRNDVYGPGAWSNNLSAFKNFRIHEATNFQLRVEAFNAFNHTNLGNPGNISFNVTAASNAFGNPGYTQGSLTPASSSSAFGYPQLPSTGVGRTVQIAGKINF